jgi:Leucine rich repeat/Leucine Rich repeat
MIVSDTASPRPATSRSFRWKRYSLRSLFVLMTVSCVGLGAWSVFVNPYRLQARSLAEVNRLQGEVRFEPADGPDWHRWLVVNLLGDDAFTHVTQVNLAGRPIDDNALRSLTGLTHLMELNLDHTRITDDGLTAIRSMPELSTLSLRYTPVSNRSAAVLSGLPKLNKLLLTGTKLSDETVAELAKISSLSELYVRWTQITDDGAARLAEALPACTISHHALVPKAVSSAPP